MKVGLPVAQEAQKKRFNTSYRDATTMQDIARPVNSSIADRRSNIVAITSGADKLLTKNRKWLFVLCGLIIVAAGYRGNHVLQAAPDSSRAHQTVPLPTPTPLNTPVPTATPVEEDRPDPTATATPTESPIDDPVDGGDPEAEESPVAEPTTNSEDAGSTEAPRATPEASKLTAIVEPVVLNVRSGPGTDNSVVGTLFQGDRIEVLERSENWWLICCPLGLNDPGWIDSAFVTPEFSIEELNQLVPVSVGQVGQNQARSVGISSQALSDSALKFQISHAPTYIWPGQDLVMTFVVTNTGTVTAEIVRLRDDFPSQLHVIEAAASESGEIDSALLVSDLPVLLIRWPELAPSRALTATVWLEVDAEAELGSVIDNLAVAEAENAEGVTAGITIGMPPVKLPDFQ